MGIGYRASPATIGEGGVVDGDRQHDGHVGVGDVGGVPAAAHPDLHDRGDIAWQLDGRAAVIRDGAVQAFGQFAVVSEKQQSRSIGSHFAHGVQFGLGSF